MEGTTDVVAAAEGIEGDADGISETEVDAVGAGVTLATGGTEGENEGGSDTTG